MQVKNKYAYRAKISESKLKRLVKLFASGANATLISEVAELNRNSVNKYLMELRELIAMVCEAEAPSAGDLDYDAYFLDLRQDVAKGGQARVDKSFAAVWSSEPAYVHIKMVPMDKNAAVWGQVADFIKIAREDRSVKWRCYEDFGYRKYFRADCVNSNGEAWLAGERIEAFWGGAKERIIALRGVPCHTFYLHLKECQFRFNNQAEDLARLLLGLLQKFPLGRKEAVGCRQVHALACRPSQAPTDTADFASETVQ